MSVTGITFQDPACPAGNIGKVTKEGTFTAFVNRGVLTGFPPDSIKKVFDVKGSHPAATSECCSVLARIGFTVFYQFPIPVI